MIPAGYKYTLNRLVKTKHMYHMKTCSGIYTSIQTLVEHLSEIYNILPMGLVNSQRSLQQTTNRTNATATSQYTTDIFMRFIWPPSKSFPSKTACTVFNLASVCFAQPRAFLIRERVACANVMLYVYFYCRRCRLMAKPDDTGRALAREEGASPFIYNR